MKQMKRLLCCMLALMLVLASGVTAFAENGGVTNVIESLNHKVTQNGAELTADSSTDTDVYTVKTTDGIVVDYTTTMDMTTFASSIAGASANAWDTLIANRDDIGDRTTVNLNITFSDQIDLSGVDFSKATLTSDIFKLTSANVDGQTVTLVCNWDSAKVSEAYSKNNTLNPLITLSGVPLKIKSDWDDADSITVTSGGSVTGTLYYDIHYPGGVVNAKVDIDGGSKSDSFTLKLATYTVTYTDGANGEAFKDQVNNNIKNGTATPAFTGTPTREGYTFEGWSPAVSDTVTADAIYTAQWKKVETPVDPAADYTITFKTEEGGTLTGDTTATLPDGEKFPAVPETTAKSGYTFAGWYDENGEKVTTWPETVTGDATYTAKWTKTESETTPSAPTTDKKTNPTTPTIDKKTNTTTPTAKPTDTSKKNAAPKTGDTASPILYTVTLLVAAGAVIAAVAVIRRKRAR